MQFGMGGKSNAKVYVKSSSGIKFSDVAGEDEAKELLSELVDYLHTPEKYREIGVPTTCMSSPSSTGWSNLQKQLLVKQLFHFLFQVLNLLMSFGTGAAVHDLFKQANEKAPCILSMRLMRLERNVTDKCLETMNVSRL